MMDVGNRWALAVEDGEVREKRQTPVKEEGREG